MKMSPVDFKLLETACMETLKSNNLHPFMVNSTLRAWEVFHKATTEKRIESKYFYSIYNDAHIETALKKIFLK